MSERGSFVTEYIYCKDCFKAAAAVLLDGDNHKYFTSTQIPNWVPNGDPLPIITGKCGGLHRGEEIEVFEFDVIQRLEDTLCHKLRIAILAESGEKIFTIIPSKKMG